MCIPVSLNAQKVLTHLLFFFDPVFDLVNLFSCEGATMAGLRFHSAVTLLALSVVAVALVVFTVRR